MLQLDGVFVFKPDADFSDVVIHGAPTDVVVVVPFEIYARKFSSFPICCDRVGFLEGCEEVLSVWAAGVLDVKVVHNENKGDGSPFVFHSPGVVAHW